MATVSALPPVCDRYDRSYACSRYAGVAVWGGPAAAGWAASFAPGRDRPDRTRPSEASAPTCGRTGAPFERRTSISPAHLACPFPAAGHTSRVVTCAGERPVAWWSARATAVPVGAVDGVPGRPGAAVRGAGRGRRARRAAKRFPAPAPAGSVRQTAAGSRLRAVGRGRSMSGPDRVHDQRHADREHGRDDAGEQPRVAAKEVPAVLHPGRLFDAAAAQPTDLRAVLTPSLSAEIRNPQAGARKGPTVGPNPASDPGRVSRSAACSPGPGRWPGSESGRPGRCRCCWSPSAGSAAPNRRSRTRRTSAAA